MVPKAEVGCSQPRTSGMAADPLNFQSVSMSNKTGFPTLLLMLTGFTLALRQNGVVEG